MQISCLELEERKRVEETRVQSSCLEYDEKRRFEREGCRAVA